MPKLRFWMLMVGAVTLLSGLLFGYDQGVISGALTFISQDFDLGSGLDEVITSWVTLGALFGALLAGVLADRLGRRITLILAGVVFVVGALTQSLAGDTPILVAGRLIIGLGVGVASVAAPLYAAEMAPAEHRGRYVSMYQLAITIGIFLAYIADAALSSSGDWRLMLGIAAIPGVALAVTMWTMPDTPRWLMKVRRREDAKRALVKMRGDEVDPDAYLDGIEADLAEEAADRASWGEIFGPRIRPALYVGLGLAIFQQITGINAVIYYANEIFDRAGFTTAKEQADATLFAVGAVNVLATFIAVAFVDRFGRKPLLLAGLIGMGASLTAIGFAFLSFDGGTSGGTPTTLGILTLVCLVVYIASFAFSLGPVVWTIISEIYPNRIRGRAIAVATAANWAAAFLVSQFFLTLLDDIGESATFWLFAASTVAAYLWISAKVPETKGRSLEEISAVFEPETGRTG
jgi:sugar porter (SP) family MFS transporter